MVFVDCADITWFTCSNNGVIDEFVALEKSCVFPLDFLGFLWDLTIWCFLWTKCSMILKGLGRVPLIFPNLWPKKRKKIFISKPFFMDVVYRLGCECADVGVFVRSQRWHLWLWRAVFVRRDISLWRSPMNTKAQISHFDEEKKDKNLLAWPGFSLLIF